MDDLLSALQQAYYTVNYDEFCRRAGLMPSPHALDQFQVFKRSLEALCRFDPDTLALLLEPSASLLQR